MTACAARRAGRAAAALAALAITALPPPEAAAAELPGGGHAVLVAPACRVRAEGALDCDPVDELRCLQEEVVQVQLVVDAGAAPLRVVVEDAYEQLFVPVRARSRGAQGDEALPWAAAARPADATILGRVADPLRPRRASHEVILAAGERRAWWIARTCPPPGAPAELSGLREPAGGPRVTLQPSPRVLPAPVVSVFAYLERDEPLLGRDGAGALAALLEEHGVVPVARATTVDELLLQLAPAGERPREPVVLGAYGTLGEPTDEAVARAVGMAAAVPSSVRDVVLYAVDEDCASDLGPRWRARLDAEGSAAARRVKVLVTCGEDPRTVDADVVMMPAERFRPREASAARASGKEVWVYNGRLPQAGAMALDAPPESMVWLGWIAARYDVGRWFLWNVNHWSDGNRGGHGPRDPLLDPETFHNADGDAVLYDGLLVFPPERGEGAPRTVLGSVRLRRLAQGLTDATLLGLVASLDPRAARRAIDRVVPRALGDVRDDEPVPFGDARAIADARALLHDAVARADAAAGDASPAGGDRAARTDRATTRARAGLLALRVDLRARAALAIVGSQGVVKKGAEDDAPSGLQRRHVAAIAVASCLGGGAIAAWRLARRRAQHRKTSPPVG